MFLCILFYFIVLVNSNNPGKDSAWLTHRFGFLLLLFLLGALAGIVLLLLLFLGKLHVGLSGRDGDADGEVGVGHVAVVLPAALDDAGRPVSLGPVRLLAQSLQLQHGFGLLGLLPAPLEVPVEEVAERLPEPQHAALDASDGDLQVVHFAVLVRGREVVGAEGAEEQRQEQVQDLRTEEEAQKSSISF